ncbi:hypothetical protein [Archangium sp.]|jgi:hypothetical protein|uniref:hypothetical protein n=1 Tax=Archangium sp. TaxID=1872627 RepID=UPI00389A2712
MCQQSGQTALTQPGPGCLGLPPLGAEAQSACFEGHGLPSFVSAAPPRSEGEALLRRIFSRAELS